MTATLSNAIGWTAPVLLLIAANASAQTGNNVNACKFAGEERQLTADTNCPGGLIETFRTLEVTREIPSSAGQKKAVDILFEKFGRMLTQANMVGHTTYTVCISANRAVIKAIEQNILVAFYGDNNGDARANIGRHVILWACKRVPLNANFEAVTDALVQFKWLRMYQDVNGRHSVSKFIGVRPEFF